MRKKRKWVSLTILRERAFERQGGLCHWCGRPMIYHGRGALPRPWNNPRTCTADHLIRKADGGKSVASNIVAACSECNSRRHDPPTKRHNK